MKEIASNRYNDHCKGCEFNSTNAKINKGYSTVRPDEHCTDCGCNLDWKTHCMDCSCPKDFWGATLSEEDGTKLQELLKE